MQGDAGSCTPWWLHAPQVGISYTSIFISVFTAAVLMAVATSIAIGLLAPPLAVKPPDQLTVAYKNQLHPSKSELEAREPHAPHKGEASSQDSGLFNRQGQWI